jgi:hypothetical protein
MPIRMLKRAMPFREFLGWCDWIKRYPIDDESHAAYLAQLASIYVNAHRPKNKKPTTFLDFLIFRPHETESLSMDEKWRRVLKSAEATQQNQSRNKSRRKRR